MDFSCISNESFKRIAKEYFKQRLLSGVNCSWGTAQTYLVTIHKFMNFYSVLYPERTGFEELDREDIRRFIAYLSEKNPESKSVRQYVAFNLKIIRSFLTYMQLEEFEGAPTMSIPKMIRREDYPVYHWSDNFSDNRYVPEYVLCQLLNIAKYEILIKSAESMVQLAEFNHKDDMCKENKTLLNIYRNIHEKLEDGGIIYGRPERIERLMEGTSNG